MDTYTLIARYNDLQSVRTLFEEHHEDIAAVIVEPIAGEYRFELLPEPHFLHGSRDNTPQYNSLLIFDEVITQIPADPMAVTRTLQASEPDLTTLEARLSAADCRWGLAGVETWIFVHMARYVRPAPYQAILAYSCRGGYLAHAKRRPHLPYTGAEMPGSW